MVYISRISCLFRRCYDAGVSKKGFFIVVYSFGSGSCFMLIARCGCDINCDFRNVTCLSLPLVSNVRFVQNRHLRHSMNNSLRNLCAKTEMTTFVEPVHRYLIINQNTLCWNNGHKSSQMRSDLYTLLATISSTLRTKVCALPPPFYWFISQQLTALSLCYSHRGWPFVNLLFNRLAWVCSSAHRRQSCILLSPQIWDWESWES